MKNKSAHFSSPILHVYGVQIHLKENNIQLDGNEIVLPSEMAIKAEINTNKHRVTFSLNQ